MSRPYTCAIIRKLKKPNKFGETYRIDFHRFRDGQIDKLLSVYDIDSIEKAYTMLRGNSWVQDTYDIAKIVEMDEDDIIPGHETPVLDTLHPTHMVYQLDLEQFQTYLNNWLQNQKGLDVTIEVYGENGGGYGDFGFTINDEHHQEILKKSYDINEELEFELVEKIMYEVFQTNKIDYEYDVKHGCLMVYKAI